VRHGLAVSIEHAHVAEICTRRALIHGIRQRRFDQR
jgi:hypothetical protein